MRTHQLLIAILGAASRDGSRRSVARELLAAIQRAGDYRDSREELTPIRGDLRATIPVVAATGALMVRPSAWSAFATGSVKGYSLTPESWALLQARTEQLPDAP